MISKKELEEIVYTSPLVLLGIKDKSIINTANEYLPYSTGFEIECDKKETYDELVFKNIPNIIWDSTQSNYEQRYRIPNGVNGLICLYNICYHLGNNSLLNMESGIHYHIDCTDVKYTELSDALQRDNNFGEEILTELDSWDYRGTYNKRKISIGIFTGYNWIRYNGEHHTLEFRIGNMSFDYGVLVKQIIHANNIVRRWKNKIVGFDDSIIYNPINYKDQIEYQKVIHIKPTDYEFKIQKLKQSMQSEEIEDIIAQEDVKQQVKTRLHKLY